MIIDQLSNVQSSLYPNLFSEKAPNAGLAKRLQAGFEYLLQTDFSELEPSTIEIDGKQVFAMIQKYNSKPVAQGFWESHRKYIDIQYVVDGVEQMGYANLENLTSGGYDAEKDLIVHEGSGSFVVLHPGMFALLFPADGHMPQIAVDAPRPIRKVVVKVAVDVPVED